MDEKILEIIRMMHGVIGESELRELKSVLTIVLGNNDNERYEIKVLDEIWRDDLDDFLTSKELEGKSSQTINRYQYELTRMLSYVNKSVREITATDISKFMRMYKQIRKISNQTLKGVRAVYSSFFVWLRDRGRIYKNPVILVEQIKVEKKIKNSYSDSEREKMLRNCKSLRDKAIIEFLYSTAVRVGELIKLNRSDVKGNEIIVYGKGDKERRVYLNGKASMYLHEYLESRTDNNNALFVSAKKLHNRLSKEGIEYIIREIGKKCNIDKAHPHKFRRTTLTNALNRGMPLQEVMILAGHSKPETTMLYCNVDQEAVRYHHKKYLSA